MRIQCLSKRKYFLIPAYTHALIYMGMNEKIRSNNLKDVMFIIHLNIKIA